MAPDRDASPPGVPADAMTVLITLAATVCLLGTIPLGTLQIADCETFLRPQEATELYMVRRSSLTPYATMHTVLYEAR